MKQPDCAISRKVYQEMALDSVTDGSHMRTWYYAFGQNPDLAPSIRADPIKPEGIMI